MKRQLFIILIWLWLTLALLALFISRIQPFQFIDSNALVLFIESSKLFFIVIIFPFTLSITEARGVIPVPLVIPATPNGIFINKSSVGKAGIQTHYLLDCLKPFIIFILLSLPLTIMASYLGNTDWGILLRANLLLLLIAVFISLLSFRRSLIYYLTVFLLFGVGPILYYLVLELSGASWGFLVLINPFWLFWQMNNPGVFSAIGGSASGGNPAWLVQCLIWTGLIIIALTTNRISKEN